MSWLDWIRGKKSRHASGNEAGSSEGGPRPGRRELDRSIARLNERVDDLPDGPEKIGARFERAVAYKERAVAWPRRSDAAARGA